MPVLQTRKIGHDEVTAIGYGAMGISSYYATPQPDEERLKVRPFVVNWDFATHRGWIQFLDGLYARGCTNWDTADVYGDSEVLIGKWYALHAGAVVSVFCIQLQRRFRKTGKRNDIFLATKFGITNDPQRPANGEPEYVNVSMDKSLSRLGGLRTRRSIWHTCV